jgi:hypothetical protein
LEASPVAPGGEGRSALLGAAIAGAGGVLLFIALFLEWYSVPGSELLDSGLGDVIKDVGGAIGFDTEDAVRLTGWEAFEFTDVACAAAAAVALARAAVALIGEPDNPSVPGSILTLVLGGIALALIVYRFVNPPYVGMDRELGVWIGLFSAGAIVYGSFVAMRSDRS